MTLGPKRAAAATSGNGTTSRLRHPGARRRQRQDGAVWALIEAALPSDLPAIRELLEASRLPVGGLEPLPPDTIVARLDGRVMGCVTLERYGDARLLRSLAIAEAQRGSGLGTELVRGALARDEATGARDVFLLTETASAYFPRFGFAVVDRREVPATVQASAEFGELCPASAVAMRLSLAARAR